MDKFNEKTKRDLTPYQKYMKINVPRLKSIHHNLSHKEIFNLCASSWKNAPENPKNQK
jgi:hypothetical protein